MAHSKFDVIVIGGGHAGVEAAAIAARMGAVTALLTQRLGTIGAMSCNPAIGGLGKGHLVREIDALDGVMGRAADSAAIHFRVLNRRKGPAVQGPRVQADRGLYKTAVLEILQNTDGLTLIEGECASLDLLCGKVEGVHTIDGRLFRCKSVVIATGTFLNGVIHIGSNQHPAGRIGDQPSTILAMQLAAAGYEMGRLKTGTPPRLDGRTIDFNALEQQWGDEDPQFLSSQTRSATAKRVPCFITRTSEASHRLVRDNLHRTARYSGALSGKGPRYCPSIEDKIVRFADKESHQIFLEPEGEDNHIIYPNGISTSLPEELQAEFIRNIPGMQNSVMLQPGYAIEYNYINPVDLLPTLMSRRISGLFLAGQINGTTGYEEAGAQGLVAGLNAVLHANNKAHAVFDRTNSYVGVMIDDLITRGVTEPYRMFTSRAEYRLSLRADNADERLTPIGIQINAVGEQRRSNFNAQMAELSALRVTLHQLSATRGDLRRSGINFDGDESTRRSAFSWASFPEIGFAELARFWPELNRYPTYLASRVEADAKYHVYVERQSADVQRYLHDEKLVIPKDVSFDSIPGLSAELRQRFATIRPTTMGQAGRIEGATPAALLLIAAHARRARAPLL